MFTYLTNWIEDRRRAQVIECCAHRRGMLETALDHSIDERVRLIEEYIVDMILGRLYPVDVVEKCKALALNLSPNHNHKTRHV